MSNYIHLNWEAHTTKKPLYIRLEDTTNSIKAKAVKALSEGITTGSIISFIDSNNTYSTQYEEENNTRTYNPYYIYASSAILQDIHKDLEGYLDQQHNDLLIPDYIKTFGEPEGISIDMEYIKAQPGNWYCRWLVDTICQEIDKYLNIIVIDFNTDTALLKFLQDHYIKLCISY